MRLIVIFAGQYGELRARPPNLAGKKEEGKREWLKLEGWSNKGRRGTGGEEKKGDPTPDLRSPPTFQPWLHLWCEPEEKTVYLRTWELWLTADDSCEFRTPILSPARAAAAAAAGARHCKPLCRFFAYFRLGGRLKCGSFAPTRPGHFLPDITIAACVLLHLTITVTNSEP